MGVITELLVRALINLDEKYLMNKLNEFKSRK